ncbi:hypothetical protein RXV86_01120 [Alisedimentitalea sp. MJ-SS2]|uniref:hypothetical protein n=1 Tax=Aliisedimentitalea sp. MJ-SS2 TaxID=3049795 RepID=UPI00290776E7|nr:hypothetical protein [Alisedimentitalea sp. MJ-SS2]MDU8925975.1 hypothetical protein [Alisedimentitalea sp. MJ-SS2]
MPETPENTPDTTDPQDVSVIDTILARIRALQSEMEAELSKRREAFRYRLERGRVVFEDEARRRHRKLRVRLWTFLKATRPMVVLTAPFIYALIVPFVLLDLFVTVYQAACFPVYGIPKVPRRDHIRIDRHHLAYLNGLQKLNCIYCGYCNGVLAWVREVAGRTEAYWCPIKHAGGLKDPHRHYAGFVDFGDGEGFDEGLARSRKKIGERPDET